MAASAVAVPAEYGTARPKMRSEPPLGDTSDRVSLWRASDPFGACIVFQLRNIASSSRKDGALIDVTLVGYLACVDRGWLSKQKGACRMTRRASTALPPEFDEPIGDCRANLAMGNHIVRTGAFGQAGLGAAGSDVRE